MIKTINKPRIEKISTKNGTEYIVTYNTLESSNGMTLVENDWREVPHYDKFGELLTPEKYKEQVVKRNGLKFFESTEENKFLGSSATLISGDILYKIEQHIKGVVTINHNILNNLDMYSIVKENHNYIISVDTSKDGIDDFSISVTDVTKFPFEQVASANLQVDYLVMPDCINELGIYYNNAFVIVENVEGSGQSITDQLFFIHEYPNLYRDKNINGRVGFKKYTGFRTTKKSRPLILNMLKVFIEEGKLIINSHKLLTQLYTFSNNKGKYQAQDGFKDDAVMSMCITFAPFLEVKVFDNFDLFTKHLHIEDSSIKTTDFISTLDIGSADDGTEDYEAQERLRETRKQFKSELGDDYSLGSENYDL